VSRTALWYTPERRQLCTGRHAPQSHSSSGEKFPWASRPNETLLPLRTTRSANGSGPGVIGRGVALLAVQHPSRRGAAGAARLRGELERHVYAASMGGAVDDPSAASLMATSVGTHGTCQDDDAPLAASCDSQIWNALLVDGRLIGDRNQDAILAAGWIPSSPPGLRSSSGKILPFCLKNGCLTKQAMASQSPEDVRRENHTTLPLVRM
jgi:hypothetical protein